MKHKLVLVGFLSSYTAYLDVPEEEALRRWHEDDGEFVIQPTVKVIEFDDEFNVYNAQEI
jgi:hypothetical protein